MKVFLYRLWQCTWGIIQTVVGGAVFLLYRKEKHFSYHGSIVTVWNNTSSVSLGMFVFITGKPYFADKLSSQYSKMECSRRLLVHEYGHTIQSLILGPLYLILMGIPSSLWAGLPCANKMRKEKGVSYFSFFTESWANTLGEMVTKEKSMERLIID